MSDTVKLVEPHRIERNPDNPRLVFRQEDMDTLQDSIAKQGILVPLTIYEDGKKFRLLDGERRWLCALKLGLSRVPVIVQPKPDRLTNIMMMFAIHNARRDWDPLPTALKLQELEKEFTKIHERSPREAELAGLASISRGEVRRLKKLLGLPGYYRDELLEELKKPRSAQVLTVDHVLEATTAALAIRGRDIVDDAGEERLRRAIVNKFKTRVIDNTVAPRKLSRLARAVGRGEVTIKTARQVVDRLTDDPKYTIDQAFADSVERVDFEHGVIQLTERILAKLDEYGSRKYGLSEPMREALRALRNRLNKLLD